MAKYLYQYNEERGDFYGYVEDADGNDIWSVSYPELIEDEESGELYATPTIFDDGFMKNPDDVEGLEDYLKSIGILEKGDELVSERDDMEDDDDEYAEGGEISEVDGNTEVRVGNFTFYFDGVGDMARLTEIYHRPTDMMGDFDSYQRINLSQMKNTPNSKMLLVFEHPTMGRFQLRGGFQILKERPTYVDGSMYAEGGETEDALKKFVKSLPSNTPNIINNSINKFGEVGIVYALDYIIESGETNVKSKSEHNKIMDIIEDNEMDFYRLLNDRFKNKIKFAEGGETDSNTYEKVKVTIKDVDMGGDVVYKGDHWFRKDQLANKTNEQIGKFILNKYFLDYGNTYKYSIVRTGETKTKMAEGGETEEYARGGVHKVNPKYDYFALNKKNNKIYDAWEIVDDVESLKYYAKMDLKDNDLNPSDFNLLSAKTLKARGIDPFSWDSWAKDEDYYANGGVIKWQDVNVGDSANVKAENKTGLIVHTYGRKFNLKFANGSEKTYDANELEFIQNDDDEFAKGGVIQSIKNKLEIANKLISDEKTMIDIDEGREVKYMPLKLKGQRNDLVITIKVKENGRWVNYHNYLVTEWDEGYGEETRLEALNRIIKELKTSKVELMADGGMMAKGGSVTMGDLERMIEEYNEDGRNFELRGAYGNLELWSNGHRLEVGSKKDIKQALIKYRFNEKYASGGTLENKLKKRLNETFELPMEMAIYVPSTRSANEIISKREFASRIEEVQQYMSDLFGGYSSVNIDGGYISEDANKGLIREDVARVTSFGSREGFESKFNTLINKIVEWCKKWSQESIGFEFEGDMFYVGADAKFEYGGMFENGGETKLDSKYVMQNAIKYLFDNNIASVMKIKDKGFSNELNDLYSVHLIKDGYEYKTDGGNVLWLALSNGFDINKGNVAMYGGMFGKGGVVVPDDRLKTHEQSDEERELELYIDNDVTLYNQRKFPIEKNLIGKLASGKFDINQAPKIYKYLIDDGIKKYTKDFGGITLTKDDKENLAKNYVNQFLEDADSGQFDEFIPKKYRMDEGGETDGSDDLLEFTIPNWALSSLINGDDSGLEDEDIEKIEKFVNKTSDKYGNANFMLPSEEEMDLGFKYRNDIDNLGSDCSLLYLRPSKDYADGGYMAKGGATFDEKVTSISESLIERKKVSPKVQKDYGKTYNKKEAIESAKRIAGALRKKEMAKKKG